MNESTVKPSSAIDSMNMMTKKTLQVSVSTKIGRNEGNKTHTTFKGRFSLGDGDRDFSDLGFLDFPNMVAVHGF